MSQRRLVTAAVSLAAVVSAEVAVLALEARVSRLRVAGSRVAAVIEIADLLQGKFLRLVRDGRSVFIQVETSLWEDRRVFDRLVLVVPPRTWRLDRDGAAAGVLLLDQHGGLVRHADVALPLPLAIDLGPASRIEDEALYYAHAKVTAATVDEQDIERAGQAIFGDEESGTGLSGLGRFVFRTLLRMGKYFESASAEVTGPRVAGRAIRSGAP